MDSGAAGHVMHQGMFPCVKLERKTATKRFGAANGEQIRDVRETTIPCKTNDGIHRCTTLRCGSIVKPLISIQKVVQAGNVVVLKLDVTTECTQWTCGYASMKQIQFSAGRDGEWPNLLRQACEPGSTV